MRTTFLSRGGPRAEELLAGLSELYPVYEGEPGVFDVYGDDQAALLNLLDAVMPNWRMYLQLEEGAEGAAAWRGWRMDGRTPSDETEWRS